MPGQLLGTGQQLSPGGYRRPDRWLNFQWAWPPERDIRDREDSPGSRNPYNLWPPSDLIGGEDTGMTVMKLVSYDDDVRFGGRKGPIVIVGQTLDSGGSPAPGMKVELWQIAPLDVGDGIHKQPQLMVTIYSDADGMYAFTVPNATNLYKVEAYDGSKGGVTVRNLTGA